jgi:hypothetical protein
MRGEERRQRAMLMIVEPGDRVPKEHPLRRVKEFVDAGSRSFRRCSMRCTARSDGPRSRLSGC